MREKIVEKFYSCHLCFDRICILPTSWQYKSGAQTPILLVKCLTKTDHDNTGIYIHPPLSTFDAFKERR